MSQPDYNPEWWKEAKAKSLERREQKLPDGAGDAFLIVTEGTVTEPTYFSLICHALELSTVTVKVIPGTDSHPRHVIGTAKEELQELKSRAKKGLIGVDEISQYDQVWAVIDTDVLTRENQWTEIVQLAKTSKVKLADSSPCFEFWLLLHLNDSTAPIENGEAAKKSLKAALGTEYSTTKKVAKASLSLLFDNWPEAITRAKQVRDHHTEGGTPLPANPSTQVDLLVQALNNASPRHKQRL